MELMKLPSADQLKLERMFHSLCHRAVRAPEP
jgi:hypothetical protein